MKNTYIAILIIVVLGFGAYFLMRNTSTTNDAKTQDETASTTPQSDTTGAEQDKGESVIGKSVEGRDIVAYHYGTGATELLLIGGIHGGYSWNTTLLAYEVMDFLKANPTDIPANMKVTIIPVLNPDGLNKVVGTADRFTPADVSSSQTVQISGRYNADKVDISRNFDCNWQAIAKWQNTSVSGGTAAFSEPESQAIEDYVLTNKPKAVVVWYSAAGGVYASQCNSGVPKETSTITNLYAKASGYPAHESYDFYDTTGDMVNWFAKNKIPAISVLLTNHTDTELTKNQAGIKALLEYYTK